METHNQRDTDTPFVQEIFNIYGIVPANILLPAFAFTP